MRKPNPKYHHSGYGGGNLPMHRQLVVGAIFLLVFVIARWLWNAVF